MYFHVKNYIGRVVFPPCVLLSLQATATPMSPQQQAGDNFDLADLGVRVSSRCASC